VRPLANPPGWLMGVSYRTTALSNVFAVAGLGQHGLAAMIDTERGGVQAVAGTAALRPKLDLGNTPMFTAMQQRPGGGIWEGRTPIDGVERIIAFRRVPDRDLIVLVGVVTDQVMAPAESLATEARTLAAIASLLVLAIGATVLWEVWHWRSTRRRRRALAQAEALVTSMQTDLAALRAAASVGAAQLPAMPGGIAEGAAAFDAGRHLTAWNPSFATMANLPEDTLREGVLLDVVLQQMVLAGRFGPAEDAAAEVARLVAALRPEAGTGEVAATGQDGTRLVLRAHAMTDGRLVLTLGRAGMLPEPVEEPAAADPVEW
jgi:PAS domain-containing protein